MAVIHPDTAPELVFADPDRLDADFCLHQPFFSSVEAAAGWLAGHPGGQILPVTGASYDRLRDLFGLGRHRQPTR